MVEKNSNSGKRLRSITLKALKATVKGMLAYALYFVLWMLIAPTAEMVPGLQQAVETLVIVYIILIIVAEFTSGTIFRYFFDAAKELFVIGYLIISLKGGLLSGTHENVNFVVDIRLFLVFAILLGLLGFAKSVLQAINYLNEMTEYARI